MNKKTVISATDSTIRKLRVFAKKKKGIKSKLVVTAKKLNPEAKELAVTTKGNDLYKNKKTVISATDNIILELKVKAEDLAAVAKEKEDIRLKLEDTAKELKVKAEDLAAVAKEKEAVGSKLVTTARELAATAEKKEDIRKRLAVTAKNLATAAQEREIIRERLAVIAKQLAVTAKEKEDVRKKLAVTAENLRLKAEQLAITAKEKEDAVIAASNVLEDLNAEKLKYEFLSKDLEKFKLAFDNVSDNIIMADLDGIVIYVNKAVETITGYKPEEAIGKKSGALWKTPMPLEFYQKMWDTIKKQKQVFVGEIQNKRKSGEIYTAAISIYPILDKNGEAEFFVSVERDITKDKELDHAKTEFVAVASHALRTPLTAITGLVSMIQDGEYGEVNKNLKQPLEDVQTSSERLIHLVNDLLNLSRIQAGRMKYTLSEFSIVDAITETVHLLQPLSEQKGLQLTATKLEPVIVQADSDKVKEILNNLIGNSLKFTDSGSIIISTKVVDNKVEVHISDTGIGIKKEDQQKLFGLFQQIESGEGRPIGTGFGLHISRELVSKMGGELWIEKSKIGKGSVFVFSVPMSKSLLAKKIKEEIEKEIKTHPDQKTVTMKRDNKAI